MKTLLKSIAAVLTAAVLHAQVAPPIVVTNVVHLTATTRLSWDASQSPASEVAGYWVRLDQGSRTWSAFTTNLFIPILTLASNIQSGPVMVGVRGVNHLGTQGGWSSMLNTNLSIPPLPPTTIRFEVIIQ